MKRIIVTPLFLLLMLFAACETNDNTDNIDQLPDADPIILKLAQKVGTDNTFALDLFKVTYKSTAENNVFISPLSVNMALNMALNGAKNSTAAEMLEALRAIDYTIEQINEYSKSLSEALLQVDPSTKLTIANSIWYKEGFQVKSDFISVNKGSYNAEVNALDFSSPDAVTQINSWCAKQTNDKIKKIIDEISGETMMYLINAIYFKGIWVYKFDKSNTRKEDFHLSGGQIKQVDMMRQTEVFDYYSDEYFQYLALPYGNKAFSMVIMLPQEGKTMNDVVDYLDGEKWDQAINSMSKYNINLRLPKFKTECEYKMQKTILPSMGMSIPFSKQHADFSGISDTKLFISQVIHKTFVEVNEEGTEAAAVTAIGFETTSPGPINPIDYYVNKPFLFAIRENSTGVILFMGKMGDID